LQKGLDMAFAKDAQVFCPSCRSSNTYGEIARRNASAKMSLIYRGETRREIPWRIPRIRRGNAAWASARAADTTNSKATIAITIAMLAVIILVMFHGTGRDEVPALLTSPLNMR